MRRLLGFVILATVLLSYAAVAVADATGNLIAANATVIKALSQAEGGDLTGARATYGQFRDRWFDIEDGIRDQSRTAYRTIESEMSSVQFALLQNPPDRTRVVAALTALRDANQRFISGGFPLDGAKAAATNPAATPVQSQATAPPQSPAPAPAAGAPSQQTGATAEPPTSPASTVATPSPASASAPATADSSGTATAAAAGAVAVETGAATGPAAGAAADMFAADALVAKALGLAQQADLAGAEAAYQQFHDRWFEIEDGIRQQSKGAYRAIEERMGDVAIAFKQRPQNGAQVLAALQALHEANQRFIRGDYPRDGGAQAAAGGSVSALLALLDRASDRAKAGDAAAAAQAIAQFRQSWLDVEGIVLTQSAQVYTAAERDMVDAYALLTADPPDLPRALAIIDQMRAYLAPIAGKTAYSFFDAATIVLREGLEALLVLAALLAFLKKSGHGAKGIWIWTGAGVGLAVSAALAVLIKLLIGTGAFGNNNFLIAGWTGLFAAAMLVYVSYWLHSKSSIAEWNRYIREKSTAALATGSLFSLATLSFLAVFREGTETVLFYIGMAASISLHDLLLGLGLGFGLLAVLAFGMIKLGVKIPLRPFFLLSSLLIFYLAFKFTGEGIHGLQLAGVLPATVTPALPSIDFLALYPNWQSTLPQLALLLLALGVVLWGWRRDRLTRQQSAASQG